MTQLRLQHATGLQLHVTVRYRCCLLFWLPGALRWALRYSRFILYRQRDESTRHPQTRTHTRGAGQVPAPLRGQSHTAHTHSARDPSGRPARHPALSLANAIGSASLAAAPARPHCKMFRQSSSVVTRRVLTLSSALALSLSHTRERGPRPALSSPRACRCASL